MILDDSVSRHVVRRRLWKAGSLVALFIITLLISNEYVSSQRAVTRDLMGKDFLPFYAAGSLAREGQFQKLYDLAAIKNLELSTCRDAGLSGAFGPWWNPPFAAWMFALFSALPFGKALMAWELFGLTALIVSIFLLARLLPAGWRNRGLIPLLISTSAPFWGVVTHGQNSFLTLLLVAITATFWRKRRVVAAGVVAGLLLYKPQHAAVIAVVLTLSLGWQAAFGFLATAALLVFITIFTMPGALGDYVHSLPRMMALIQEGSNYSWDRHVTLKAFWRLLLQGSVAGSISWSAWIVWWGSELLVIGALWRAAQLTRTNPARLDRLIAAAIVATPLLVPFFFDYDLMILAVAAVLCAADGMRNGIERPILWGWTITFFTLFVGVRVADWVGFNPTAPALAGLLTTIVRRPASVQSNQLRVEDEPAASRALAA